MGRLESKSGRFKIIRMGFVKMTMVKSVKLTTLAMALVVSLSACSWLKQPAAPVETSSPDIYKPTETGGNQNPDYGGTQTPPPTYPTHTGGTYIPSNAPVDPNATFHTVVYGDTLYNVSKRYGISQANIIEWNNMQDITVKLGTRLRVKPAGYTGGSTNTNTTPPTSPTKPPVKVPETNTASGISWMMPTQGSVVTRYTTANRGIDISGSMGQPVVAAASGKVVYSGSGLRGYGNLVIVQHNQVYLSAYAHNRKILVKEGQSVSRGQKIAEMGNSDADRVKLHFEIRKQGEPIDPAPFLKI